MIALVITIIVLLILAGVTIATLTGEGGILNKANTAKEENQEKTATEIMNLKITNVQIESYKETEQLPTLQYLADKLCEDSEIKYVELTTQKNADGKKISVGKAESIFTQLKDYPYEFEIDRDLRLAAINGIKVGNNDTVSKSDYDQLAALVTTLSQKVTELEKNQSNNQVNPVGTIIAYSTANEPEGYLKCEGQAVSRTEYSGLFHIIGTNYGNGDGSTTFNVPDLRGEFLRGAGTNASTKYAGAEVGTHQQPTAHLWLGLDYREKGYARFFGQTITSEGTIAVRRADSLEKGVNMNAWTQIKSSGNQYAEWTSTSGVESYTSRPTNTSVLYCIKY